jgi:hypothetical protein
MGQVIEGVNHEEKEEVDEDESRYLRTGKFMSSESSEATRDAACSGTP